MPGGRHFYGHGAFSSDGHLLFTTENDFEAGRGRIGVWDTRAGYRRIDEWDSGGVGPHDIKRLPNTETLVVANGGIDTHPDSGRTTLNIPTMRPNLTYIEAGAIVEVAEPTPPMHKNSIRHLAVNAEGQVAFGMQWQGDGAAPMLVGTHVRGQEMVLLDTPLDHLRDMRGYVGSICYADHDDTIAVTSPRGGIIQFYDARSGQLKKSRPLPDVCGAAASADGILLTSGTGALSFMTGGQQTVSRTESASWDNHLIPL
ncbi:Twin-arginine translocation pathway signal [Sulfitobacter noctilucae]|nr:Twin-arginine translocation pathway signal [Sulfitobacter noctilucae]